jgi:hypothetical protein
MTHSLKPLAAAALALAAVLPSQALTIDSFDGSYTTNLVYFGSGPPVQSVLQRTEAASVPGGSRRTELVADVMATGTSSASLNGEGDLWAFATGAQRLNFNFSYGNLNPMNLDLSGMGAFRLDMYINTPMKLLVYATTETAPGANPDGSAFSVDMPELFRQSFDIPLASFTTNSGTGRAVNWADVDGLAFFLSANGPVGAAGDAFWTSNLVALPVPEPSSALLMAVGLALLIGIRRQGIAGRHERDRKIPVSP